jgi:hypothetical protein
MSDERLLAITVVVFALLLAGLLTHSLLLLYDFAAGSGPL